MVTKSIPKVRYNESRLILYVRIFRLLSVLIGVILLAWGYRYNQIVQVAGVFTIVLSTVGIIIVDLLLYNASSIFVFSRPIRYSIWIILGVILPSTNLLEYKEWIWQENMIVGLCVLTIIGCIFLYLSVPPAMWFKGGFFHRDATHEESLRHFGRNPLIILGSVVAIYFTSKEIISLTKNNILLLDIILNFIKKLLLTK